MSVKVFVLFSSVLVCSVSGGAVLKPIQPEPYDLHPQYNFGYSVHDAITGDIKAQQETRDGDVVQGQYSLVEPDGSLRTVTYVADANGFNAVVDRQAAAVAVAPVPVPAPVQILKARTYAVPAQASILPSLPALGSHHQPIISIQQQPIAVARPPPAIQLPVIQQRPPVVHPIVIQQQQQQQRPVIAQPIFPALPAQPIFPGVIQPRPPVQVPVQADDPFDQGAIEIPSADFPDQQQPLQEQQQPQQPIQIPPPSAPVQVPQLPQQPPLPVPQPPQGLPPIQNPVQIPQPPQPPPPPQAPVQLPPLPSPPQAQQPTARPPANFDDDADDAFIIDSNADLRSARSSPAAAAAAGPSRDGSSFTYSSSRGNQFNFRIAV